MSDLDDEEECVWGYDDCVPIVLYDLSGEPWCARCRDAERARMIAAGDPDPEIPIQ